METEALLRDLNDRIGFIGRFYLQAVRPFEATQREIVLKKQAALLTGDGSDNELAEEKWKEATKCVELLGHCCLSLLEKALHDYLRKFAHRELLVIKKSGNWFRSFCKTLSENTGFDWATCPVTYDQIEQINLSRNDFTHDPDIDSDQPRQSEHHYEKHPRSRFRDQLEGVVIAAVDGKEPDYPISLRVTKMGLFEAFADVRRFCEFVEVRTRSEP